MKFLCFGLLVCLVAYTTGNFRRARMLGGINASPKEYPYQVSIQSNDKHICGGAIIDSFAVLTVASCIQNAANLKIVTGITNFEEKGQIREVTQKIIHPGFDPKEYDNDLVLLKLKYPFVFSNDVNKLMMRKDDNVKKDDKVMLSGFGAKFGTGPSNSLQYLHLTVVDPFDCGNAYQESKVKPVLFPGKMCAKTHYRTGVCTEDFGSPVADSKGQLVGLLSWMSACGSALPAVFTYIPYYAEWISSNLS